MFSKSNSKAAADSGTGKFTTDLKIITEALHSDKPESSPKARTRPKTVEIPRPPDPKPKCKDPKDEKEKKPSLWTWKGLKALTNARARRFNCSFSLLVHKIEGLPTILNDAFLVVHWRRKDGDLMTRPVRAHQGVAQLEENLTHSCIVYGNRSGPHRSARYEPKNFLLYASVYNSPDLDLGRHRVDVTRLLPLTLDELENEKSSGKWTTSFGLSGKARGATVHVSFGYAVVENGGDSNHSVPESPRALFDPFDLTGELSVIRRVESLPARLSTFDQPSEDVKDLHEVLPVEEDYGKLVENNLGLDLDCFSSDAAGEKVCEAEGGISEFSVVEKGVEVETVVPKDEQSEIRGLDSEEKENDDVCSKESLMKDLETALSYATELVNDGLDSQEDENDALQREDSLDKLPVSDDLIDSVANDFLNMLGIDWSPSGSGSESEPESPRECLLKQFEKDALAHGGLLDLEIENDLVWDDESSLKHDIIQEKPELESSVDFHPPNKVCRLPPLAEGVGPFVRTKNGGFLRSMSPGFFPNGRNGGSLVMQVSSPVVVPVEMGCNVMDVLRGLAGLGIEKLSVQANRLMPLEDITGSTIHRIAWEAGQRVVGPAERQPQSKILQKTKTSNSTGGLDLLDIKNDNGLDEWTRFDSGKIEHKDLVTLALTVQLRDPLRDYEPVGGPMLSLIQFGRVFGPSKFRIYREVPPAGDADEDEGEIDEMEKSTPRYEIVEVAVAGLKKVWGPANQEKSGSRWLLANGMGKKKKHPLMKASSVVKGSYVRPNSDKLWSVSSGPVGQHVRNTNVVFRNGTMKLR